MSEELVQKIESFLQEKKVSSGGWPEVTNEEMASLHEILGLLISLKYERDPDGSLPVEFILNDRTRFERQHQLHIPYTHNLNYNDHKGLVRIMEQRLAQAHILLDGLRNDMFCLGNRLGD